MPMQIDVAELAGIVVEGVLYGIFVVLSIITFYHLLWTRRHSKLNVPMVGAAVVMSILATCQLIVDTDNIFKAFIDLERPARLFFLIDATQQIFAAKHAIYFTQMIVGDAIVIYRAYVVWGGAIWVVVVPILCSIGSGISAYQTIWATRHVASISIIAEAKWGYAIFSLSLAANVIATSLIAYRIWQSERQIRHLVGSRSTRSSGSRSLTSVIRIIVETGAINAGYLLAYTFVLKSESHGLEIMASISTPLIGILFSMVIIRATINTEREETTKLHSQSSIPMPITLSRDRVMNSHADTEAGTEVGEHDKSFAAYRSQTKSA
ncbi:hypothetical protein B0H16DRAFT_1549167 [Mycena metata]|uniref:Uncharacterized protein n=1 Tax=Mycena metata TaxID=1033252 RepID=A0AAD7IVV1_9AGAR|nr:hypothetical protein B0H16DRAFT_1549167 [Mycena metata]